MERNLLHISFLVNTPLPSTNIQMFIILFYFNSIKMYNFKILNIILSISCKYLFPSLCLFKFYNLLNYFQVLFLIYKILNLIFFPSFLFAFQNVVYSDLQQMFKLTTVIFGNTFNVQFMTQVLWNF